MYSCLLYVTPYVYNRYGMLYHIISYCISYIAYIYILCYKSCHIRYGTCTTLKDPQECDSWYVYNETKFDIDRGVTCVLEPLSSDDTTTTVTNNNTTTTTSTTEIITEEIEMPEVESMGENMFSDNFEIEMPEVRVNAITIAMTIRKQLQHSNYIHDLLYCSVYIHTCVR